MNHLHVERGGNMVLFRNTDKEGSTHSLPGTDVPTVQNAGWRGWGWGGNMNTKTRLRLAQYSAMY